MQGLSALSGQRGSGIIAMIGVVAVLSVVAATLMPHGIKTMESQAGTASTNHLMEIGEGVKSYLRTNKAWPPTLAALSPEHVQFAGTQLTQNENGYLRYYFAHPTTSAFTNGAGIDAVDIEDTQFLLITNLTRDEAPTITNATEFDAWWDADASGTPGLFIYRGVTTDMFHRLELSVGNSGGSHQIDGATINSGGGTLAAHNRYHVRGTAIGLDDQPAYATPELTSSLVADEGYTYCSPVWQRGVGISCQGMMVRDEFRVKDAYNGNDGTKNWSSNWQEFRDSDGAHGGRITVTRKRRDDRKCVTGHCLKLDDNEDKPRAVRREVDLSGATKATLTFSYLRDTKKKKGVITLRASDNGGGRWRTLQTYRIDRDDRSHIPQSFDLTPYIASNTQIQFMTSGADESDKMYIDDVQIVWQ